MPQVCIQHTGGTGVGWNYKKACQEKNLRQKGLEQKASRKKALGEASQLKNGKIADFFPNRLDPPPPSDISGFFEFQTYLKNADPPSQIISDISEFENILMTEDPPDSHLKRVI